MNGAAAGKGIVVDLVVQDATRNRGQRIKRVAAPVKGEASF